MKLLLCHPDQAVSFDGMKARAAVGPPLGILSIAAYVRESGWQGTIEIYDARLSCKVNKSNGATLFGDPEEEIANRIRSANADVIGISNMFTSQISRAYKMAEIARRVSPKAVIVIGGPHVSVFPLEALAQPSIDYVIIGEGEERMASLLKALNAGTPVRTQGVLRQYEDIKFLNPNNRAPISFVDPIDKLPIPAYDLVDMDTYFRLGAKGFSPRYREWGQRPISMLTSRGCPNRCVFCSIQSTMGYKFRYHSVAYIKRHIRYLINKYGVDFIHFEDDNFLHLPKRYDQIVEFLLSLEPKVKWDTPNGVRGDTWNLERVSKAKKSGCQFLIVAIESAVQRVLDKIIHKQLDLSKIDKMIQCCHKIGLRLHAFYIIGFPGESVEDMKATIEYALDRYRRYGVMPLLQPLIPIPGTDVWELILKQNLYVGKLRTRYNQVTTPEFHPLIIRELYKQFLRRRLLIFAKRTFTSMDEFLYNIRLIAAYPKAVVHEIRNVIRAIG